MHFSRKTTLLIVLSIFILSVSLSGCLPVSDTDVSFDQPAPVESITTAGSDSGTTAQADIAFTPVDVPVLTTFDLADKNIGRRYVVSGILTEASRANSGSILLTIANDSNSYQVYLRSGLSFSPYMLCIGESYQIIGSLDEYEGTYELIPDESSDILHDGKYDFEAVTVTDVIDGDTVKIQMSDGTIEKLRVIGVDAPETEKYDQPGEFYAEEATDYAGNLLLGKTIYLERDNSDTDKYGRLLRYIWMEIPDEISDSTVKELNFSALLLAGGYAEYIRVGDDDKYADLFSVIDQKAADDGLGMWQ